MIISAIIVTACFIGVIALIMSGKMNRAIAALAGAIITYFVLTFIEGKSFFVFIDLLFGTETEGFVNLHALLLILGMLFIVQVCHSGGVFQFLAFKLIQMTKGKPINLLFVLCGLAVLISALINNILTVIVLIPLTIVASRILSIDPSPYIIAEAILVNVGGILFTISSIPNILISFYAGISFGEFFLNIGVFAIFLFLITLVFFRFYYKDKLMIPKGRLTEVLQDFNVWNFVPDKRLFYKSVAVLITVLVCFAAIPSSIIPPDIIAISGGIILIIISRLNGKEIVQKIDLELILYLMGIFIIIGAMESLNIVSLIGDGLIAITGGNAFVIVLTVLWVSAFLSSSIDNIPITKVLIPVVDVMSTGLTPAQVKSAYYSLAYGANLGDNLTPMGDNILVMNLAEQNDRPISVRQFFKLGFISTIIQLIALTIYFIFLNDLVLGFKITFFVIILIGFIIFIRFLNKNYRKGKELVLWRLFSTVQRQNYNKRKNLVIKTVREFKEIYKRFVNIGKD